MTELDKHEAEQIALVEGAAKKAIQTIRDYFAMQRTFLGGVLAAHTKQAFPATGNGHQAVTREPKRTTAKVQDTINVVLNAIKAHPKDVYTFPEINDALEQQGSKLSRDQLRRTMEAIAGKAPVFQVSPRRGSVAGVYSRVPVDGTHVNGSRVSTQDLYDFSGLNQEGNPREEEET